MAFVSLEEQNLDVPEQRTPAWFKLRKNRLTGSRLSEFNFINTEERLRQYYDIIFNGGKKDPFTEEQLGWMKYGVENEPIATECFVKAFPEYVILECPFYPHSDEKIGASPDGEYYKVVDGKVVETGIIEIKTPAKTKRPYPKVKDYYISQMYFEMAVTGERNAIFISWGPRCMRAWKLVWDDHYWQCLSNLLHGFNDPKLPFETFLDLKHALLDAQQVVIENSIPLHQGKGVIAGNK